MLCPVLFGWIFVTSTRLSLGLGSGYVTSVPPGTSPVSPPCILNLPPASLRSSPSPKSLLREPQAFPAASSMTPRGPNHSLGARSLERRAGVWAETKEDAVSEQRSVQGGLAHACWKEKGRKEAEKEEMKAGTAPRNAT